MSPPTCSLVDTGITSHALHGVQSVLIYTNGTGTKLVTMRLRVVMPQLPHNTAYEVRISPRSDHELLLIFEANKGEC